MKKFFNSFANFIKKEFNFITAILFIFITSLFWTLVLYFFNISSKIIFNNLKNSQRDVLCRFSAYELNMKRIR